MSLDNVEEVMKKTVFAFSVLVLTFSLAVRAAEDAGSLPEKELALVEKLVLVRGRYEDLLREIGAFYSDTGNVHKKRLVQKELDALVRMDKYDYIVPTIEAAGPPSAYIPEAERLFKDGVTYFKYFDLFDKKRKLNISLARFRELLKKYPTSDKADDAAFYIGAIYESEHFKNYETAVKFYQLCHKLNPLTEMPARIRMLDVYYKRLKDFGRSEALAGKMLTSPMSAEITKASYVLREMRKHGRLTGEPSGSQEAATASEESAE